MPEHSPEETDFEQQRRSKSSRKREMHALQAIGESLVALKEKELARIPVTGDLLAAIRECRGIRSNSARRRQLQYIGKLMRAADADAIARALAALHGERAEDAAAFHALERLRADMLAAGTGGIELALARWPHADRQHLRQLILQHQRELARNEAPAASRKLFRYLRQLELGER